MPRICYVEKKFTDDHLRVIKQANDIIADYDAQGFKLTLRQLYYQFVSMDFIPNTQKSYKRLGGIINDARLAGLIDWNAIEDRTRNLTKLSSWDSPAEILDAVSEQFRYDMWADQDTRVEVWIEKEALVGVIEPTCQKWRVPYFACRGYTSQSEAWGAGQRFLRYFEAGQAVRILHLGDHDPSGIDMTRDNDDRLAMFTEHGDISVKRLALNMNQIKQYKPPPNPAKFTDSRAKDYIANFGKSCWELDALKPGVIAKLIETEIVAEIDLKKWTRMRNKEDKAKRWLADLSSQWEDE